ncbi:anti-sigma factor family protein [Actinophytocola sediminis]
MNSCTQTVTLGAYLLGALEPPERYEFEAHIADCDSCRTELIRLAPLPGMLNQISVEDFDEGLHPGELYPTAPMPIQTLTAPAPQMLAPPPELLQPRTQREEPPPDRPGSQDTVEFTPRPRRAMRRVLLAAAAVVVLAFGGVLGWQALREQPPAEEPGITWTGTAPESDVRADVRLLDNEWGTELRIKMANMPPGHRCYAVVFDHYGRRETIGWWGTDHDEAEVISAPTSFQRSKIDRVEFKLEDKITFLTIPAPVG